MTADEQLLDELRPGAFAIAYRMLGTVSEAEDIVQEALLRMHRALQAGERIASPAGFLATVTTRLAINELRSARVRRERYVGEWLPEPIVTEGHADPVRKAELADSLSLALLVVLESLSPEQRAVFLLHDVFEYPYPEIAAIVGEREDNVRQLASRARRQVQQRRPRFQATREQRDELAARFFAAVEQGDLAGLEALLAHDVVLDPAGLKQLYAPDIVSFDVGPAMQTLGAEAKCSNWVEAFAMFQPPLGYEVRDLAITVDGNLAVAHGFARLSGTMRNGSRGGGFWVRATVCLRKIGGDWLVAHDHVSVPVDPASGRGLLTPDL